MNTDKARQKRFTKRSRKGCITCRVRRKRCDEVRPICDNCVRVNVPCEYAIPQPVTATKKASRQSFETTTTESKSSSLTTEDSSCSPDFEREIQWNPNPAYSLSNGSVTKEQQFLLTYYIYTLVPTFSVVATSTAYHIALYVPMAFQSIGILNAILACAASHLSKTSISEAQVLHFRHMTKVHALLSQQYLQQCVTTQADSRAESDEVLVILMLLVALETQNGSQGSKWQKQLQSAGRIIANRGGPKHFINAGWESRSVFGHFLYHDCCSMIMSGILASLDLVTKTDPITSTIPDWTSLCSEDSLSADLVSGVDPLMGLASSLFTKIRRISRLTDSPPNSMKRTQLFTTLEREINEWTCDASPIPGSFKGINGLELATQLDLIALAETHRLAALILLYRTSSLHTSILPKIGKQIMTFVARIPDGNQVESGLPFSLFMAGGELVEWKDMQACALKLRGICERTRIMNIEGVGEVLEQVWRAKLNGGRKDWVEVLKEEKRVICIA